MILQEHKRLGLPTSQSEMKKRHGRGAKRLLEPQENPAAYGKNVVHEVPRRRSSMT